MDHLADEQLLALTPAQPAAFAAFYRRHEELVVGYFMRRTGDPELAADLAAETFATMLLHVRRFDASRGAALAWAFGIARNVLLRARERGAVERRARRRLGMAPLVLDDDAIERISGTGGEQRVAELLDRLPTAQAEAVRARILEDKSYRVIADEVKCSEGVVRQRVSRGLARLRSIVEEAP